MCKKEPSYNTKRRKTKIKTWAHGLHSKTKDCLGNEERKTSNKEKKEELL